jgi:DNA-binding CsgD family transcriptional regulator
MGIHRERRDPAFGEEERKIVSALLPHLARVLQIAQRLGVSERQGELSLRLLHGLDVGLVLVDSDQRLIFMNAVAERLVRKSRWLTLSGGRVRPIHPASAPAFSQAVCKATATSAGDGRSPGATLRLRDPLAAPLQVLVAPFRSNPLEIGIAAPAATILFADPDPAPSFSREAVREAFDLTPAEARLVVALAAGKSLADYAAQRRLSRNTVRAQLRSVFLKTGFSRQSELVGAVLMNPLLKLARTDC